MSCDCCRFRRRGRLRDLSTFLLLLLVLLIAVTANSASSTSRCPNCMHQTTTARPEGSRRSISSSSNEAEKQQQQQEQQQSVDGLRIEAIKQQILNKLGLKQKPNITTTIPREVILETLWRADEGKDALDFHIPGNNPKSEADDYYARTSEIITFAEPGGAVNGQTLMQFSHRHDNPQTLRVKGATLWVQLRFRSLTARHFRHTFHERKITLFVFRALQPPPASSSYPTSSSNASADYRLELVTSSRMSVKHIGWKKFDLQESVQKWFRDPLGERFTLLLDCAGCGTLVEPVFSLNGPPSPSTPSSSSSSSSSSRTGNRRRPGAGGGGRNRNRGSPPGSGARSGAGPGARPGGTSGGIGAGARSGGVGGASAAAAASAGARPFLAIVTEPIPFHRVRRRALECDSRSTHCCKKSLYVSFKILQWDDWIIAPQGYYANYCMGDCSRRGRTPDTFVSFHTHVIEQYRNRNPYATIQQCCAPTKLTSMSLIYFDQDETIIKTDLPNMIVDECGCA